MINDLNILCVSFVAASWCTLFQPDASEIYNVENENDYKNFLRSAKTQDFSDLQDILRPTQAEYDELGHQLEDLIVQCSFDRVNCNTRLVLGLTLWTNHLIQITAGWQTFCRIAADWLWWLC